MEIVMDKNIIFEKANVNMCDELAKLKLEIWESTYRGIYPNTKFDNYNYDTESSKFKKWIQDPNGAFFVAKDTTKNQLIGYTYIGFSTRCYIAGVPEIILLYIHKDYQHMGIGQAMFQLGYNYLQKSNYKRFIISCNKYNINAQKFYIKMGGKIIHIDEDNIDHSLPQIKFEYTID